MTEEEYKEIGNYREQVQVVANKSEDEFEKRLLYIAAGALGLSFSFITDIVSLNESKFKWLLIAGWGFLTTCILINLLSHIWTKHCANKIIDTIDDQIRNNRINCDKIAPRVDSMNVSIKWINTSTVVALFLGIAQILTFATINIYQIDNNKQKIMSKETIRITAPIKEVKNGGSIPKPKPIVFDFTSAPNKPNK